MTSTPDGIDWRQVGAALDAHGYARLMRGSAAPACAAERLSAVAASLESGLSSIARDWHRDLSGSDSPPPPLPASPWRPTVVIDRLRAPNGRALQPLANDGPSPVFPLALIALLSRPGEDFDGGQWIIVEQRPRMQSRPIVVALSAGDVVLVPTSMRRVHGASGPYRTRIRHAISPLRRGERIGLLATFDPPS